jgi:cytochrome c5
MLGISSWISPGTIVPLQQETPASVTPSPQPTEDSWIIVDLPADASQLEYGAEVYRLVCKACHGDKGQGLTDDWRAQWAPRDQNCWQSKCHALNHPPDGFYLPYSPPVVGPPLQIFGTALDLYNYIHNYMPWHDRGSMTQKESWSVTAYILKINSVDPGLELDAETAAKISLRGSNPIVASPQAALPTALEDATTPLPDPAVEPARNAASPWLILLIALIMIGVFVGIWLSRRSAGSPPT